MGHLPLPNCSVWSALSEMAETLDDYNPQHSEDEDEDKDNSRVVVGHTDASRGPSDEAVNQEDTVPCDRGWAWVIVFAFFLNNVLICGYYRAMGVLILEFLSIYQESMTMTALYAATLVGTNSIGTFFTTQLVVAYLEERKTIIIGGFLSSSGIILSYFAKSIIYLICVQAVLFGIGMSMIFCPGLSLIGKYFKKRRGIAIAIGLTGVSVGAIVTPPLMFFLLEEYELRGACLILGALQLNLIVGGLLSRPISFYSKKKGKSLAPEIRPSAVILQEQDYCKSFLSTKSLDHVPDNSLKESNGMYRPRTTSESLHSRRNENHLIRSLMALNSSASEFGSVNISVISINIDESLNAKPTKQVYDLLQTEDGDSKSPRKNCKNPFTSMDFSLFKNPLFMLFLGAACFAINSSVIFTYIPAVAVEQGVSKPNAAILLSLSGAVDLISKLAYGWIADLRLFKVNRLLSVSLLGVALMCQIVSFFDSFPLMITFSVIVTLFAGAYICLYTVLIIEFVGIANLDKALGFLQVIHGITISVAHPVFGALRDATGNCAASFHYLGICCAVAAIILTLEPCVQKRCK